MLHKHVISPQGRSGCAAAVRSSPKEAVGARPEEGVFSLGPIQAICSPQRPNLISTGGANMHISYVRLRSKPQFE